MHVLIQLINDIPDAIRYVWMQTPVAHVLYTLIQALGHVCFEDGSCR